MAISLILILSMSPSYHNFDRVSSYSKRLLFGRRERFVRLFERVDSGSRHKLADIHYMHEKICSNICWEYRNILYFYNMRYQKHSLQFVRSSITCSSLLHVRYYCAKNKIWFPVRCNLYYVQYINIQYIYNMLSSAYIKEHWFRSFEF